MAHESSVVVDSEDLIQWLKKHPKVNVSGTPVDIDASEGKIQVLIRLIPCTDDGAIDMTSLGSCGAYYFRVWVQS